MTHRAVFSIAAGALIALSGPALAQSQAPLSNSSIESTGSSASADSNRRICVRQETTGSRLRTRVCRTRDQWEREGGIPQEETR